MTAAGTWTLLGVAGVGVLTALVAIFGSERVGTAAAGLGWIVLLGGAVGLYTGGTFDPAALPAAFAMGAGAALAVLPAAGGRGIPRSAGALASVLVAGALTAGGATVASRFVSAPWDAGAVLIGVHWAALAAAAASALAAAFLVASWIAGASRGDADATESNSEEGPPASPLELRARARDAAARAVALMWLAWPVARLIHWRFLGATGIGTRSEWFGLGVTLLATGGLLVGWDLAESRSARVRSAIGPIFVAAAVLGGIWASFGYGSPFALSIGS